MPRTRVLCDRIGVVYGSGAGSVQALSDVSLDLAEGEFVSLVGPSGCGKTTLLRTLAGFVTPRTGSIEPEASARSIGLVPQDQALFPWMTALANAAAGMKQRVAVARAFLSGASLLLMDEPFGALDAMTRQKLQQELMEEWTARRPAVLFVTHDVEEAILLGSRVLVMSSEPGAIVAGIEVPFDHPRPPDLALTSRFVAIKRDIYALLGLGGLGLAGQEYMTVSSR
jgi:NitT/TauT family transport system ATP-binding protein